MDFRLLLLVGGMSVVMVNPSTSFALKITQPQPNAIFQPGDAVHVLAEAEPGEQFVPGVLLDAAGIDGGLDLQAPYEFDFKIPPDRLGSILISAAGKKPDGKIAQAEVKILVILPSNVTVQSIDVDPSQGLLFLEPEVLKTKEIGVAGVFSDSVKRSIKDSSFGTAYQSSDEKVVTVDAEGVLHAIGVGKAIIIIKNGDKTVKTQVEVRAKTRNR